MSVEERRAREILKDLVENSQSFEMRYEEENIWLTQKMMAALYDVEIPTINEHIKKIFLITNFKKKQLLGNSE